MLKRLLDEKIFTDNTVEAAIHFIEIIGQTIEERLKKSKGKHKNQVTEEDY